MISNSANKTIYLSLSLFLTLSHCLKGDVKKQGDKMTEENIKNKREIKRQK